MRRAVGLVLQHGDQRRLGAHVAQQTAGEEHVVLARLAGGGGDQRARGHLLRARHQQQVVVARLQDALGQVEAAAAVEAHDDEIEGLAFALAAHGLGSGFGRCPHLQGCQPAAQGLLGLLEVALHGLGVLEAIP
ncbi:MAG: hypothetical protein RMN53_16140 [Anaerolineae bacterium]|nr:hypothetical protein [Anaerolineae bacterium]